MLEIQRIRQKIDRKRAEYYQLASAYQREASQLVIAKKRLKAAEASQEIIQTIAQQVQQKVHKQISSIVSKGLRTVFDYPYDFEIIFHKKRGKTEAELIFKGEDGDNTDPINSTGGGIIDIAAFTLRVACLVLSKPRLRPVLILDEPFKNVSKEMGYLLRIPQLLESLCEDLNLQIIIVTHINELKVGTIIEIGGEQCKRIQEP